MAIFGVFWLLYAVLRYFRRFWPKLKIQKFPKWLFFGVFWLFSPFGAILSYFGKMKFPKVNFLAILEQKGQIWPVLAVLQFF